MRLKILQSNGHVTSATDPLKAHDGSFLSAKNTTSVDVMLNNLELQLWQKKSMFPKQWMLNIKTLSYFRSFHSQNEWAETFTFSSLTLFVNILGCSFYPQIKWFVLNAMEIRVLCLLRARLHKQTFFLGEFSTLITKTRYKFLKRKYFIVIISTQFRASSQFYYLHNFLELGNSLLSDLLYST